MKRFLTWLKQRFSSDKFAPPSTARQPRARIDPARGGKPATAKKQRKIAVSTPLDISHESIGGIADGGPGKNILMRPRMVREDTGTHDTLKIIDDSLFDSDESDGIDPYNTGRFDRSKFWDKSSLK